MTRPRPMPRSLLLLGAGELGKELAMAAQGMGLRVVAVDRYEGAPAMQVADDWEVISLDDGAALEGVIRTHRPDLVIPEFEPLPSETLQELEEEGFRILPTAEAASLPLNRELLRDLATKELGIPAPSYGFASSRDELREVCDRLGYPCIVKPVAGFAGERHFPIPGPARVGHAWSYAEEAAREDGGARLIVEELVDFDLEITLLAVREWDGATRFVEPIGHRQERGAFRESWLPAGVSPSQGNQARDMARKLTDRFGGAGVYGVEFFVAGDRVLLSELWPRPHETGMVTLVSQDLSQFDLHLRAVMGLPIPEIRYHGPAAAAVILAEREGPVKGYEGLDRALQVEGSQVRIFGKPEGRPFRRMGVALASAASTEEARSRALEAASRIEVRTG